MSAAAEDPGLLCPSAQCEDGAILLGVVGSDGLVGYVRPQLRIDEGFVREAHRGRAPERRFRFAQSCVEARCEQWTGSRCGVIDEVVDEVGGNPTGAGPVEREAPQPVALLPRCTIRSRCRWFHQSGATACAVCPLVITDLRPEVSANRA